jgi:hypothetical protein
MFFKIFLPPSLLANSHILKSVRWPCTHTPCAHDIWWTLDLASAFLSPGTSSSPGPSSIGPHSGPGSGCWAVDCDWFFCSEGMLRVGRKCGLTINNGLREEWQLNLYKIMVEIRYLHLNVCLNYGMDTFKTSWIFEGLNTFESWNELNDLEGPVED